MVVLRINEILKEKGLSTKEFAEKTGLSYVYSSEVIRNVKFPRKETLIEIAKSLNVDIRDLFHSTKSEKFESTDLFVKDETGQEIKVGEILSDRLSLK